MPFKPGQSGNPGGGRSQKEWRAALLSAIIKKTGKSRAEALAEGAEKLVDAMMSGDVGALREFGDRIDGKPTQEVDQTIRAAHEESLNELDNAINGTGTKPKTETTEQLH